MFMHETFNYHGLDFELHDMIETLSEKLSGEKDL